MITERMMRFDNNLNEFEEADFQGCFSKLTKIRKENTYFTLRYGDFLNYSSL